MSFFWDELIPINVGVKKLHPDAIIPTKANPNDAGFDLYFSQEGVNLYSIRTQSRATLKTGIVMEIPEGYAGFIWDRSGLAAKSGIHRLAGVIDSDYRGEIMVCLFNTDRHDDYNVTRGERIAQIVIQEVPKVVLFEIDELSETERGEDGFGSSGK
jgi:dUTP pyrophosphatase